MPHLSYILFVYDVFPINHVLNWIMRTMPFCLIKILIGRGGYIRESYIGCVERRNWVFIYYVCSSSLRVNDVSFVPYMFLIYMFVGYLYFAKNVYGGENVRCILNKNIYLFYFYPD